MKGAGAFIWSLIIIIILLPLVILLGTGGRAIMAGGAEHSAASPASAANGSKEADEPSGSQSASADADKINIKVYIAEKNQLQQMPLEEYIVGVVSGEMPVSFDTEALKAQSVAARTYAVVRMRAFGGKGCSKNADADICTDSTHCQEWISKEDRIKRWNSVDALKNWEKINDAVKATRGMILVYDSQPVLYPLYFSTSSGKTENSRDVFSSQQPYLRSVVSPNEEEAPKFVSKASFSADDFIKKFPGAGLKKSKLKFQIKIADRTEGGSVKTMTVGSKTYTGTEIRSILDLNSANFQFQISDKTAVFTVTGYGHGVGMSQWGANEMGKRGAGFEQILKHYYSGTEIKKIEDVFKK